MSRRAVGPLGALGRWRKKVRGMRTGGRGGDVHALDRKGDPRGGVQSDEYRVAEATDLVAAEGTVMSGPGGAPQEGRSVEERRRRSEHFRRGRERDEPDPQR